MRKGRIENIEKRMQPDKLDQAAPGNMFVTIEGGRLYLDGKQITDVEAWEYWSRTKTGTEEKFEYVEAKK